MKKEWTKEELKEKILTSDRWLYGAIECIYKRQTETEKLNQTTTDCNGVGFNGLDAPIMSSFAEFLRKTGFLTPKQKVIARKKMIKYCGQLVRYCE